MRSVRRPTMSCGVQLLSPLRHYVVDTIQLEEETQQSSLDPWSRRIVGWAFYRDLETRPVLGALDMAMASRSPRDVIHHSAAGSHYTSWAFRYGCPGDPAVCRNCGDTLDNVMYKSLVATIEYELIDRHCSSTKGEARIAVFRINECFYNLSHRHSSIGKLLPIEFATATPSINRTVPSSIRRNPKPLRETGSAPDPEDPTDRGSLLAITRHAAQNGSYAQRRSLGSDN